MKKRFCFFIIVSMFIFLLGCSNEKIKVESSSERIIHSQISFEHNQQKFEVINYYQEVRDFLKAAKEQPTNLESLYKQSVLDSFRQNGVGYDQLSDWMFTTPSDTEALEVVMNKLIDDQDLINDLIKVALLDSATLLPGGNKTIHILPAIPELSSSMKEMNYVYGVAWNKDSMLILIDPSFTEEDLKLTIAHEYHHLIAMENGMGFTLLERSILEGKADLFAKIQYPNGEVPWNAPLPYSENAWKIFEGNLDSTDSELWFKFTNGNSYQGIAKWSNYRIGYQIMMNFIEENPDVSIKDWTEMSAKDILLKSNYTNH